MILKALFERIPAVLCQGSWDTDIASIAMCSKEVTNNSLFICIKGMEQDGHQYIQEAAEREQQHAWLKRLSGRSRHPCMEI